MGKESIREDVVNLFRVEVEEGTEGLLYASSPDLPGLFVTADSIETLRKEIPEVIRLLLREEHGLEVDVRRAQLTTETSRLGGSVWAAVPTAPAPQRAYA